MDLETENRIAAILMKEAAELRQQADREGVLAYLRKSNVRDRPNPRFLAATVLGVQQANRAVEVNEMWRVRQKELELDVQPVCNVCSSRDGSNKRLRDYDAERITVRHDTAENSSRPSCSSKQETESCQEGLRDEELEEFLHSRIKRGRGDIGPRMDEAGRYLPACADVRLPCKVYGPERPPSRRSNESSSQDELLRKKRKRVPSGCSEEKRHSKKHKSKDKSKHTKRRNGKKSRHE